ncbi:WD40 repeat domain-containing protein [Ktedonobacteria bacterium brp13]|nr:WD40 repeat domain-containing protein [Ktedonobacteria bacterium brp13]
MDTHESTFRPEDIDADIDQLLKVRHQGENAFHPKARLVYEMRDLYLQDRYVEESQVLDRTWERLSRQLQDPLEKAPVSGAWHQMQREKSQMIVLRRKQKSVLKQRLMGIGLGLVAALVLASTIALFTVQQQNQMKYGASSPLHGHVVFRSKSEDGDASVNWPTAGPRLTTIVEKQNNPFGETIKILDAKTNQTYASIPLGANELMNIPESWSPTGDLLAITTNERIIIVNGQTGHIITSRTVLTSMGMPPTQSSTQSHLGALSSASSFHGIAWFAWSPDGKSIASSYGSGAVQGGNPSSIQVWNPTTGDVSTSLRTDPGWSVAEISWSSDGKYIAANTAKSQTQSQTQNQVTVWNVKTQQIVFQHAVSQELSGSTWQPGTHNLAFSLLAGGAFDGDVMNLWNIDTKALMKTFPGVTASEMAWSPNGDEIAYNTMIGGGKTDAVTIMNIKSGQKVYTYQVSAPSQHTINIGSPAWSPDGKYILTSEVTTSAMTTHNSTGQPNTWQTNKHFYQQPQASHIVKIWES